MFTVTKTNSKTTSVGRPHSLLSAVVPPPPPALPPPNAPSIGDADTVAVSLIVSVAVYWLLLLLSIAVSRRFARVNATLSPSTRDHQRTEPRGTSTAECEERVALTRPHATHGNA